MYSLLAGESDNELEEQEQEQEDFCEETISLLAHEILCCEGDSDSEVETDAEDIDEARDNDRLAEILQFGLHNPYRPMLSDEDEDEEEVEGCYPIVSETIFLLDEDQQSEEKSDSSKRSF
ncbi:uncharacterized protein LOC120456977 isoform X2 [Drosophila santomea]|nr:uncharacterized protein LOC120456977 isoform X2 [Drosophila santomea]